MVRNRLMRWASPVLALLLFAGGVSAQSTSDKYERMQRRQSAFNLGAETDFTYNVNNWLCGDNNRGEICTNTFGSTTGGGGYWPAGTGNQYVFSAGLQWAARDPLDPTKFAAAFCFNVGAGNAACRGLTPVYHSDSPEDLANWPDACYIYNPQTGERVQALSQLDTCTQYWDGDPSSTVPGGHPLGIQVTQHSLAFTLSGFRDMLFFIFKMKNVSNTALFQQANPGTPSGGWTIQDLYVAFGTDHDVSFTQSGENFGTFVPFLRPGQPLYMGTIWQSDFVTTDFTPYPQCGFCTNPGFVGTTFLRSPYNTTGDTITTNTAGNIRVVPPIDPEELEPLRLAAAKGDTAAANTLLQYEIGQSFASLTTNGSPFPDPSDAGQAWRYYSGNLNPQEASQVAGSPPGFGYVNQPSPNDTRLFHATGPVTLAPGDSTDIIVGLIVGAPVTNISGVSFAQGNDIPHGLPGDTARLIEKLMGRGIETTAYPSLIKAAVDARQLFATNFLLPSPPPAPTVTVIPGNHENKVTWSGEAVNTSDPYAPIAAERGIPGFRANDFEGYRVWRKVRANGAWELIAQFDQKNGLGPVITAVDTVINQEGQVVVVSADTAGFCGTKTDQTTERVTCSTDTGLQFGIIDRGGTFPDPASGPGLTNGVTYFYAVTAFDLNTPFAPGGSSLQSGLRLSGAQQAIGGAAGTPRSDAAGSVAAQTAIQLVGGSQVLNPSATVTIDKATGNFSGPQPPTDGITLDFVAIDPLLLPAGKSVSVRIDSLYAANGYEDILGVHQQTVANCLGVSTVYFMTVTTPDTTFQIRREYASPFGLFGCAAEVTDGGFVSATIAADMQLAQQKGLSVGKHTAGTVSGSLKFGPGYLNSGAEAVAAFRSGVVGTEGGSRWFSGSPPAEPTLEAAAGKLPGVDSIYNVASQYLHDALLRYLVYLNAPYMRAADMEVTWGDNGEIASVIDLTHNVEVPFSTDYRASWGIRNLTANSGDDVLAGDDFWYTSPVAEWWCETAGCGEPLERVARLQPLAGDPSETSTVTGQGFGLFIAGEIYMFQMSQLPTAGTKWVLRTYNGDVEKGDAGYTFTTGTRPPTIPGLVAQLSVAQGATTDVAQADVKNVHTVPDPFVVSSQLQMTSAGRHIQFVNLPEQATIRIYSLSGVLVTALNHDDPSGGGTENWDLRNRNSQFVASGVYFYYVETPNGKHKVGKFTVIQAPSQTSVPEQH